MTHVVTQAMNAVEAFRIRGEAVVLHDAVHPAFTCGAPDKKYFKLVVADGNMPLPEFVAQAHHSFADGDHMGEYLETLQSLLDNY